MADERDNGFLNRWARRKQRAARDASAPEPAVPAVERDRAEAAPGESEDARAAAEARRQEMIDSLPEPEQLGPEDDYTQFLQDGVPDDLRQRALRRLWSSNPVFANLDGLNDYDLDYTDAATVVENLKTAFQVGRGMVTKDEREAEAAAAERAARGELEPDAESDSEAADAGQGGASDPASDSEPAESAGIEDSDPARAEVEDETAHTTRARYRQTPDGRVRVRGSAAQRRWGG